MVFHYKTVQVMGMTLEEYKHYLDSLPEKRATFINGLQKPGRKKTTHRKLKGKQFSKTKKP